MLNIKEIVDSTKGKLINGDDQTTIKSYCIDSREFKKGDFFIPLVGERHDGHDYILDLVKKGAKAFFINSHHNKYNEIVNQAIDTNKEVCIVAVENTLIALVDVGRYNRLKHIDVPIVAITGSVGKTSTREMIASILSTKYNVLKTEKNYNSVIGLPVMLLKLENQEVCVLELGISDYNEMEILSDIVKPNIAVVTNIGLSHIEYFKTQENIFVEKMKVTESMLEHGTVIVNGNDRFLNELKDTDKYEVVKYYFEDVKNVEISDDFVKFTTKIYDEEYIVKLNQLGNHNVLNTLGAIKVAEKFKIDASKIIRGIENYSSFSRRFEKITLKNGATIIDDAYNASFDSVKAGLQTFSKIMADKKVVVLGDILELGEYSIRAHEDIGRLFDEYNFDMLFLYGDNSKATYFEAQRYFNENDISHFSDKNELIKQLSTFVKNGTAIYFKASNGMGFIDIINEIKERFDK